MTTEVAQNPAPAAAAPAAQPAPVVPAINPEEIANRAVAAATAAATKIAEQKAAEFASKRISEAVRVLQGTPAEDPKKKFLETFVDDPVRMLRTSIDVAKREINEEHAAKETVAATQRQVIQPIIDEYPELKSAKKLALVEKLADQYSNSGMSYAEALKKAGEETVKEFNLKSVSEAQREGSYRYPGLPGGGGYSPGAPRFDEQKSQTSFLEGMKSRMQSARNKR